MNISVLKEFIQAAPFKPFAVGLPNGSALKVPHPDYISVSPDLRTVVVYLENGGMRVLEPRLITTLDFLPPTKRPGKKS